MTETPVRGASSQRLNLGESDVLHSQEENCWPPGGGEMGRLIRARDWAATPLGPMEAWPQSLKTAVGIMLSTRHPVFVFWGSELACLYNDAYAASLGPEKHPSILGMPAREAWPEAYSIVEPELGQVMAGGEATWHENKLVPIYRNGRIEEVYWTYSYGPIHDAAAPNGVGGVLAIINETTRSVEELRAREIRLRLALAAGQLGEWELDVETDTSVRAPRHDQIFGYDRPVENWGFKTFIGHVLPEDRAHVEQKFHLTAETGAGWHFECRIRRANDGEVRWIEASGEPQLAPDGRVAKIVGLVGDITERKRSEEAWRRSEERIRSSFAISTVGVMFWGEGFGLTEVNEAFLRMTGFSREEALGKTWQELTPEEFYPESWRAVEEVTTRGETTPYEKQYFRKDGSRWWGLFAARRVGDEVVEFVLDVTRRKEAEAALRESEARFRHMADSAPALIWMSDEVGQIVFANMHYDHLFGRPAAEMTGDGWRDIVYPEDLPVFEQAFRRAFADRRPMQAEVRVLDRRGAVLWLRCEGVPRFDDEGRFLGYTGCNVDITEAKVAEERRDLLINELNHRVKNTLATVQSITTQTLRNAETAAEAKEAIESRLIALSRAHDVLTRENWEGADLYEIIEQAVSPYSSHGEDRLHLKGPKVRLSPRTALALAMMLQELATNAVKYGALSNASGEVGITWCVEEAGSHPRLRLRWKESGGPLVQAPTRRGFGTRLIERSLAQDLGGDVRISFASSGVVCTVDAPLL